MKGLVSSGQVLLELARKGLAREDAYRIVQRNAMEVWDGKGDFRSRLLADPEVARHLEPAELDRAFDLAAQLRHVDRVFERVFG